MNKSAENKDYFEYLRKRSTLGKLYHRYFLYPRLSHALQGKVLDFGCGIGGFLEFRPNTVGVDINEFNIDYCKSLGLNAVLLEKGGGIPFEEDSFSGVVMDNVIEHIPVNEVHGVIDEVIRILRPIGTIVVGVPGMKGYHSDSDHKVFYTEGDLLDLFSVYGYIHKRTLHTPFYFPWAGKYIRQYCIYVFFEKC